MNGLQAAKQQVEGSSPSQAAFGSPVDSTATALAAGSPSLPRSARFSLPGPTAPALFGGLKSRYPVRPASLGAARSSLSGFASPMGAVTTSGSSGGRAPRPSRLAYGSPVGSTCEAVAAATPGTPQPPSPPPTTTISASRFAWLLLGFALTLHMGLNTTHVMVHCCTFIGACMPLLLLGRNWNLLRQRNEQQSFLHYVTQNMYMQQQLWYRSWWMPAVLQRQAPVGL